METVSYYLYRVFEGMACNIQLYAYVVFPVVANQLANIFN